MASAKLSLPKICWVMTPKPKRVVGPAIEILKRIKVRPSDKQPIH